jgi:hypothetical protein
MARSIDDLGRLFGKVSIVDLLVFIVIVALIVFAAMRTTTEKVETVPVRVTYLVQPQTREMLDDYETLGPPTDSAGRSLGQQVGQSRALVVKAELVSAATE